MSLSLRLRGLLGGLQLEWRRTVDPYMTQVRTQGAQESVTRQGLPWMAGLLLAAGTRSRTLEETNPILSSRQSTAPLSLQLPHTPVFQHSRRYKCRSTDCEQPGHWCHFSWPIQRHTHHHRRNQQFTGRHCYPNVATKPHGFGLQS